MNNNQTLIGIIIVLVLGASTLGYMILNNNRQDIDQNKDGHMMSDGTFMSNDMMKNHNMDMDAALDDKGFIKAMVPHHQEAVDTSQIILDKSNNPELVELAQNILTTQTQEIKDMEDWYQTWFQEDFVLEGEYMSMMRDLSSFDDVTELEQVYIEDMIIHHQGAVSMAENILNSTEREELKTFAKAIIDTQTKEIEMLENLKK